jgi:signal peptide peptidase SppA
MPSSSYRESIFSQTFRAFFSTLAVVVGIIVAIFLLFVMLGMMPTHIKTPDKGELILQPDADGNRTLLSDTAPVILKFNIHGIIGDGHTTLEKVEQALLDAQEAPLKKDRIKGVLLHINTPGGVAYEADGIYLALKAFKAKHKVPIYAYVDGICASGGVFVSAAADQIYASDSSVVGSVGVILGPVFNFYETMEKVGMKSRTFMDGKDKDMLNPFRPWKENEAQSIQDIVSSHYQRFVHVVTSERPRLDKEKLISVYGAQVFDVEKAKEYGYIDVSGSSYSQALSDLVKAANIKDETKYQVVEIKVSEGMIKQLIKGKSSLLKGTMTHTFDLGAYGSPALSGKILYLFPGIGS